MEIPPPDKVPSARLRSYFSTLREAILGVRPIAGAGIAVSEHQGKGTVISLLPTGLAGITANSFSTLTLDVCVDGSPATHTFVIVS